MSVNNINLNRSLTSLSNHIFGVHGTLINPSMIRVVFDETGIRGVFVLLPPGVLKLENVFSPVP